MKIKKNLLISIYFTVVVLVFFIGKNNISHITDNLQLSIHQKLTSVKITEEKIKIDDENVAISVKMPEIHYSDSQIERYINSTIRKNINSFVNKQRQAAQLNDDSSKKVININYNVPFENKKILNIVIHREIKDDNVIVKSEKDSYVFDLCTGQIVYLDNFLKDNDEYKEVIEQYILDYAKNKKIKIDKEKIKIDKYTNYTIVDGGIKIHFNPYRSVNEDVTYEFRVPYHIFENDIKMIQTNEIVANIDTQTITEDGEYINSVINIPIIIIDDKNFEKDLNREITESIMSFYNEAKEQAKSYYKDIPKPHDKFVANVDFDIKKNSDGILSILIKYYQYSGGAHGEYIHVAYNIDTRNNTFISLNDLFKPDVNYEGVISDEINKQINRIEEEEDIKGVYQFKGIKEEEKFYIQDDNLVIYFDLYEIAPYPAGIPSFPVNISIIDHILKEEYTDVFK